MRNSMERRSFAPMLVLIASILLFLSNLCPSSQLTETVPIDSFSRLILLTRGKNVHTSEFWNEQTASSIRRVATSLSWADSDTEEEQIMRISRQVLMSREVSRLYAVLSNCSHSTYGREGGTGEALFCANPGAARHALLTHLSQRHCVVPLSDLSMRDRERLLARESVFRFMFVRHPFVRSLAAYRRATVGVSDPSDERFRTLMARLRGSALQPGERELRIISFRMFLALLGNRADYYREMMSVNNVGSNVVLNDNDDDDDDLHPQYKFCAVRTVNYSFIGQIEHLARDVLVVNNRLQIHTTALPSHHSSGAADTAAGVFKDSRIRRKATRLFQDDLQAFGYSNSHY